MCALIARWTAAATAFYFFATSLAAQQPPTPLPQSVSSSIGSIRVERLTTLEYPWGMAVLPDGRVLITEKPGRLRIWERGRLSEPLKGVPNVVYRATQFEQGGMLDVEADPNFASNRHVYLSYVEADPQAPKVVETGDIRFGAYVDLTDSIVRGAVVARARLEGNELRDLKVIWRQVPATGGRGHFGTRIVFAPDGKLFLTSGERMRFDPAGSLKSNLGKVVRINSDGSIPPDNPFGRDTASADVWSYGHRNMLAAAFDPSGRLWVLEMGPLGGDELNLIQRGRNYGWPFVSNGDNYFGPSIPDHPTRPEFVQPVRTWTPVIAPSGALFYNGAMFGAWRGSALIGGLSSQSLIRLQMDGERVGMEERLFMGRRIRDVAQTPDGAILLIVDDKNGELLRLTPGQPSK